MRAPSKNREYFKMLTSKEIFSKRASHNFKIIYAESSRRAELSTGLSRRQLRCSTGLFGIWLIFLLVLPIFVMGQTENQDQKSLKEILKKEIDEVEKQISDYEEIIASKQTETRSLSNEIKDFDNQIKKTQLEIKKTELVLKEAELEIKDREEQISKIENFLSRQKILLGEFLRETRGFDEHSFFEIMLSNKRISDFFDEARAIQNIQENLQTASLEVNKSKKNLEVEKDAYEQEREDQLSLMNLQKIQENDLKEKMAGRKSILKITKGEEKKYQQLLSEAKKNVTEIKKQLFVLEGMSITFEEALSYAQFASEKTNVRPALLLAVLHVETKLGTELGRGNWKVDMKPADREVFAAICKKLKLDPDLMPVSRKPSYGWGGAMGPGQFLPRTWLLYEDGVQKLTGDNPPNPWNLKDAFVATALKLSQAGANLKTYEAERTAVLKFFAGSRWNQSYYSWYGNNVMSQAEIYQKQINILEGK